MRKLMMLLLAVLLFCNVSTDGASSPLRDAHRTSRRLLAAGDSTHDITTTTYKAMPAALAKASPGIAHTLISRRALGDDTIEPATGAFKSLLAAGAHAAASAAGSVAGRAVKNLMNTLMPPIMARPVPTTNQAAEAPIAAPPQATTVARMAAVAPAPAFAPTQAPGATLATLPASTHSAEAPAPSNIQPESTAASWQMQDPLQERMHEVPTFQLGAFLLEHANLISPLAGANGSHVIQAAMLAQQQLQAEVNYWMQQRRTRRRLQQMPSGEDITKFLTDIPQNFADLPEEVTNNVAGFMGHLGSQALDPSYYMEQFGELKHKLEDPIALQAGATLFANNLCLFSTNLGALEASATCISISPSVLSLSAAGVNIAPQAISISPALLSIGGTGVNVSPQGLNIAPALIAVTPGRVAVNPQGGTISPVGLSISAPADPATPSQPAKPSKLSQGRRSLRQTMFEDITHAVDSLAAGAQAAADQFLGATPAPDISPPAAPPAAGPAQPATTQAPAGTPTGGFTLPVALKGLHNWAAVIGTMCKAASGDPAACLHEYFSHTSTMLDSLAQKYSSLKGGEILTALAHDFPKLEVKRPTFYSGSDDVASSNVAAVQLSATGVSVSPCAVPIGPVGASINPTAVNVGPTLISISATGVNVQPQALNVSPDLIVVGPYDTTIAGQGLNIAPALITVSPTKTVVNPVGPLKVADAKVTKTLPALPGQGKDA